MSVLIPQSCRSCRRPWCSTPHAARQWRSCPFCGALGVVSGDPSLVCHGCGETLRETAPDGLCGFCAEEQAA